MNLRLHKKNLLLIGIGIAVALLMSALIAYRLLTKEYSCIVKGDSYRYANGIRIEEAIPEEIVFTLKLTPLSDTVKISENAAFPELQNPKMIFDQSRSDATEAIYLFDQQNPKTKYRTVSSVVLNTTSGDVRLFHHYWIPPKEWENSAIYSYRGLCLKEQAKKNPVAESK
jgi:hypothetical protein